jgi:hypothetical protein
MIMFSYIILRDAPKEEARLDLLTYPIQGGFRGFRLVPPGVHYVSVLTHEGHRGFWLAVKPQEAIVRRLDFERNQFVEDDAETEANFQQLALAGSMNHVLIPYDHAHFAAWQRLVSHIDLDNVPPTLHSYSGDGSRFDEAISQHNGRAPSFLAEMQFAFAHWFVTQPDAPDEAAFARWRHLLLACYNAGERSMVAYPELFGGLPAVLIPQFDRLPDSWFTADSFLLSQADYLAEDLLDCGAEQGLPDLTAAGQTWRNYLQNRADK